MRFRTYQGARPGIQQVLGALAAPGGNAYGDHMRDLAYVDSARSNAAHADSETALNQQRYTARGGIEQALRGVPLPKGLTPGIVSSLFVGSENPNLRDFTQGLDDVQVANARGNAIEAAQSGNPTIMNQMTSIAAGKPYTPYAMNESGVINQGTGEFQESEAARALVGQRNAAAGASSASANASNALARQRGVVEVSPGASLYQVPPTGSAITDAMKPLTTAPPNPNAGRGSDPNKPNFSFNSQLDEVFATPAVDKKGNPIIDPLSGRQVMNPDLQRKTRFLQWYATNQQAFPNINAGFLHYINNVERGGAPATPAAPAGAQGGFIPLEQRKIGQTYNTPRGPMIWRGNGWEAAN